MADIDPIARSLCRNRKPVMQMSESARALLEAGDKKYMDLNADEEEHDDSQAPIQGHPDDNESPKGEDNTGEEEEVHDFEVPKPHGPRGGGRPRPQAEEPMPDEEMPEEEPEEEEPEDSPTTEYENPLDNQYAVHFTLGDEVALVLKGLKTSSPKKGHIEGYDSEGFYKVKWADDSITAGLTDIALEDLVDHKAKVVENVCVCGCRRLVVENNKVVCDSCGRLIEGMDPLTLADKSRPKGKRLIRSECHPVSTMNKPDIPLSESGDPDAFALLHDLENQFWSRQNEMIEDIEELGYHVEEINAEYVVVSSPSDDDDVCKIPITGTSRSMVLDFDHMKMI